MPNQERVVVLDVYKLIVGVFVFISPWLFAFRYEAARVDSTVCGMLAIAASIVALVALADWEEWTLLGVGIWLIFSPWILGFPVAAGMKVHIGAGLLLTYLAGLELWLVHYGTQTSPPPGQLRGNVQSHDGDAHSRHRQSIQIQSS